LTSRPLYRHRADTSGCLSWPLRSNSLSVPNRLATLHCKGGEPFSIAPKGARRAPESVPAGTLPASSNHRSLPPRVHQKKEEQYKHCSSLCRRYLSSRSVSRQVFSAEASLTSVFGMGTGGPSP